MSRPSRIAIVKELGARSPRCLAAHAVRGQEAELVVVERYVAALGADVLAGVEDDTRELIALEHPNVATLIASVKLKGDVAVLSEWVDGESLASVLASAQKPSFEVLLRAATDALDGVAALHAVGGRVVGALGTEDVFLGVDGVTRITRFALGRVPAGALGARRIATMSPEFLRGERTGKGDVFTAGTLLWECFMGERLFADPSGVDAQLERLASPLPRVDVSKRDAWAAGLADVIARALSIDPAARYETIGELSRAIAAAVPSKIATRSLVSQYIARAFGEQIEARLSKLEPKVDVSFSMLPSTTQPPPAVEPKPLAKLPEIATPAMEEPKAPTPEEPKAQAPEEPKVVPPEPEPMPVAAAPPVGTPPAAAATPPARKPMQSTPDTASALARARKAAPLPKREPDSAPNVLVAKAAPLVAPAVNKPSMTTSTPTTKGNGAARTTAVAKSPVKNVPLPKAKIDVPVVEAPVEVRANAPSEPDIAPAVAVSNGAAKASAVAETVPVSAREDLDADIDLVSVRPPPIAPSPPAKKAPPLAPAPTPIVTKKSIPPSETRAAKRVSLAPPKNDVATATAASRDSDTFVYARRNPLRGPLLVLGGIVLLAGGFAAGRLTAPDPWPPTPAITATPTTTTATTTTTTATMTATTTAPTISASATSSARTSERTPPFGTSNPLAKPDAGGRYAPSGI